MLRPVGAVVIEALEAVLPAQRARLLGGLGKMGKLPTPSPRASAVRAAAAASSMDWITAGSWVSSAPVRNWRPLTVATARMRWSVAAAAAGTT